MIKRDNESLPTPTRAGGNPPVLRPVVVPLLAEKWLAKYASEGHMVKPMAVSDRLFRASWASKRCDRALAYAVQGVEGNAPSLADHWRFGLGTMVHAYLQDAIQEAFPGSAFEVPVDLRVIGVNGAATVDVVMYAPDGSVDAVVEIKTINGFGFKKSATAFKGPAEGPRYSAVVQGALAAAALDAKRLIIAYLSLENLSPSMALSYGDGSTVGQFAAEWHYDYTEFAPIAEAEVERVNKVFALLEAGVLPPREIHDPEVAVGGVVTLPSKGLWEVRSAGMTVDTGRTWMCDYCNHADICTADGEGGSLNNDVF